jgi:hypothetical protein
MSKGQSSKKAIAMACTFALALAAVAISGVSARTPHNVGKAPAGVPTPKQGARQEQSLPSTKHVLSYTYFDASASNITSSCSTAFCLSTPANMYTYITSCPAPAGAKCTFELRIAALTQVSVPGEDGLYQFLIDGAAPTGGGTDSSGFYAWEVFGGKGEYTSTYNVASQVTNSVSNGSHIISVSLACRENMGASGCTASTGLTSFRLRVLKP